VIILEFRSILFLEIELIFIGVVMGLEHLGPMGPACYNPF